MCMYIARAIPNWHQRFSPQRETSPISHGNLQWSDSTYGVWGLHPVTSSRPSRRQERGSGTPSGVTADLYEHVVATVGVGVDLFVIPIRSDYASNSMASAPRPSFRRRPESRESDQREYGGITRNWYKGAHVTAGAVGNSSVRGMGNGKFISERATISTPPTFKAKSDIYPPASPKRRLQLAQL